MREYANAVGKHWLTLVAGGAAFIVTGVLAGFGLVPWIVALVVAVLGLTGAQYRAWLDLHKRVGGFDTARMAVTVNRVDPFHYGDVAFHTAERPASSASRCTTLVTAAPRIAQRVVEVDGSTPEGPEPPYHVAWRNYDERLPHGQSSLPADGEEMIDVALGGIIDAAVARGDMDPERWNTPLSVYVGSGKGRQLHPTPQPGITSVDALLAAEVVLVIVVIHEESHQHVARVRVRIFYSERAGDLVPDLEIVE